MEGEKIMNRFKSLMVISLVFVFALVTFGCTKSKNEALELSEIKISAQNTKEGILVTFSDYSTIPPEIDKITVVFLDWGENREPDWNDMNFLESFNYFHDNFRESFCENAVKQVRKNGRVTFPFVKKDHVYTIRALFISGENVEHKTSTRLVANSSVQLNNISLDLNSNNTGVTLSDKPVFKNVKVELQKMSYNIVICTETNWPAIASDKTDDLSWNFEPRFSEYLKENNVANGDYPAYVGVNLNVIHKKILWTLETVKSPIFIYSF